jgi:hypothetical protein
MKPEEIAIDGLLRELARRGPGDDEAFVARVMGRRPRRRVWLGGAAAAALAVALLWPGRSPVVEGRVATAEGESRALELADRSRVRMQENSELLVEPGRVRLERGEATFEVTKKPAGRAFAVATEHGEIVVHGTRFTASVDGAALVVKVEEGCVEVRNAHGKATLLPGEHAVVSQDRAPDKKEKLFTGPLKTEIPPLEEKLDYDIVYVRARRAGDEKHKRFYTDFSQPVTLEPGADLMLLKPDGAEELLVAGGDGSITDPMVSFDGQWVYYSRLYDLRKHNPWSPPSAGADLYKIHVPTRKIVRLTNQVFERNAGVDKPPSYGVFNMGACPLPGGRIVFTSNRDGFKPSRGYPAVALQLFTMDDRDESIGETDAAPRGLEKIGHLNIAGALHPVVLKDGRILFSTLESQGIRSEISWGIWTIHPDGANWGPFISAFDPGGAANGFHFQTQLSDGAVVVEEYYNQNNSGFGAYIKVAPDFPRFGPGYMQDPRNAPWRFGRHDNGKGRYYRMPFMPEGSISLTPFALNGEGEADRSVIGDKASPRVGKFTHPSGAPGNHLLTVYSPGPVNHQYTFLPQLDGGLYLLRDGKAVEQPGDLRLIKNDPAYNESWPRALVPYERIYGVKEPKAIAPVANRDAVPYGFVGSSSLYKRESYPNGVVPAGRVTATYAGGKDPWKGLDAFTSHGNGMPINWHNQGADAGLYGNDEIHALRILAMEPTSDRAGGRRFASHANERLRVLGEIPVRKLENGREPLDPDGNPDTSFLAKIPADTAFTFQTLDRDGLVLNASQTWHQVRPGETRNDCGGCHAHSQKPTLFSETAAARPDYRLWDLVERTPLITSKARDESKRVWDAADRTGLRFQKGAVDVEYRRDIRPILDRSCVACHTKKADKPAGNLVLDADDEPVSVENKGKLPGTYARLAQDERARFGHKPVGYDSWGYPNASRYVRKMQSRRSLLVWKIFGKRLDGFSNDDHPSEPEPGAGTLARAGEAVDLPKNRSRWDLDFLGSEMPPRKAVEEGKAAPLSDEDRRTIARWIDLGCPIDLEGGWWQDDNRPVVALHADAARIRLGLLDYGSGLDPDSLQVTADVELDGVPAGGNLAARFAPVSPGVREWRLAAPLKPARLTVRVRDRQGNATRLERPIPTP